MKRDITIPTTFTPAVVERIRALVGKMSGPAIAAELGIRYASLRQWCCDNGVSLRRPSSITPERVARIHQLRGKMGASDIARDIGIKVHLLWWWCVKHRVSLRRPRSESYEARRNALRSLAHKAGYRFSCCKGRIGLWVAVAENLTFQDAERLLRAANRKQLIDTATRTYERGETRLNGGCPRSLGARSLSDGAAVVVYVRVPSLLEQLAPKLSGTREPPPMFSCFMVPKAPQLVVLH